jgi:1-deoxy-D-xylulose-5-phosphate reductoisomerase
MRDIAILGSTGSIGTQALQVAALHKDKFRITALTAHHNAWLLFEQVRAFRPLMAGLTSPIPWEDVPEDVRFCAWHFGQDALRVAAQDVPADAVLVSIVGIAGLQGVMAAISAGRQVLLANKEALVAGGALVTQAAKKSGQPLLPVDSEHSAIFQCLQGAGENRPEKILLTASGGPFRTWPKDQIQNATLAQALNHPNWQMGRKITIDSASMFNKALEVIEARWLFDMPSEQIEVVIHPQSVIHSAVAFQDGAVIAQLGTPDMRLPILYAMAYPRRLPTGGTPLDVFALSQLTFERPDEDRFPSLRLARECLKAGGCASCVMNAANEAAVNAFLNGEIPFGAIFSIVEETLQQAGSGPADTLAAVFEADQAARRTANTLISRLKGATS